MVWPMAVNAPPLVLSSITQSASDNPAAFVFWKLLLELISNRPFAGAVMAPVPWLSFITSVAGKPSVPELVLLDTKPPIDDPGAPVLPLSPLIPCGPCLFQLIFLAPFLHLPVYST